MRTFPLDPSDPDGPLVVEPSPEAGTAAALDRMKVVTLFERHGVLLLRGFDLDPSNLVAFTDRFAEQYSPDAIWRQARFGAKEIHTVNTGHFDIPLHSEASYGAAWPEIVFFYCSVPPSPGAGATTICDGVTVFQRLSVPSARRPGARSSRHDDVPGLHEPAGRRIDEAEGVPRGCRPGLLGARRTVLCRVLERSRHRRSSVHHHLRQLSGSDPRLSLQHRRRSSASASHLLWT